MRDRAMLIKKAHTLLDICEYLVAEIVAKVTDNKTIGAGSGDDKFPGLAEEKSI